MLIKRRLFDYNVVINLQFCNTHYIDQQAMIDVSNYLYMSLCAMYASRGQDGNYLRAVTI